MVFTIQFFLCSEPNASRIKSHSINAESKNNYFSVFRAEKHEGALCDQNVEFLNFQLVLRLFPYITFKPGMASHFEGACPNFL
jgi:hypothetical protein